MPPVPRRAATSSAPAAWAERTSFHVRLASAVFDRRRFLNHDKLRRVPGERRLSAAIFLALFARNRSRRAATIFAAAIPLDRNGEGPGVPSQAVKAPDCSAFDENPQRAGFSWSCGRWRLFL